MTASGSELRSSAAGLSAAPADLSTAQALDRLVSWGRRLIPSDELSPSAFACLDALDRQGPLRIADLTRYARITQPGMTGLVGRLDDYGLVCRVADVADRRVHRVQITDAGRSRLAAAHALRSKVIGRCLAELPAAERRAIDDAASALLALSSHHETEEVS